MSPHFTVRSFIGSHDKNWGDPQFFHHSSIEITAVLEGSGYFRWENRRSTIEAGQVILIPAHLPHLFHALSPIRFGVLLIDSVPQEIKSVFDKLVVENTPRIISLSELDKTQYESLFQQWLRIAFASLKEPTQTRLVWIQVLLLFLFEHAYVSQGTLSVTQIADFIRQNLSLNIQISDLARLAGLSEEGFRKRFSKMYGTTPKSFQQMCRLTEARWLLNTSEKDMQAIAKTVGFSQLHAFSSWFKRLEGVSPSAWRKQQRLYHE